MFRFSRSSDISWSEKHRDQTVKFSKGRGGWLLLSVAWLSLLVLSACGEAGQTPTDVPATLPPTTLPAAPITVPQTSSATTTVPQISPVPTAISQTSPALPTITRPQLPPTTAPTTQTVTPGPTKANAAHSLQLVKTSPALPGHDATVKAVAFSPDGKLLVSGSYDGTIKLWRMPQASLLKTWEVGFGISSLAFSPDGKTLLTNGDGSTVVLWDVTSGQKRATLTVPTVAPASDTYKITVGAVAFSPDGQKFAEAAYSADGGTLVIWDALSRKPLVTIQGYEVGQELSGIYGGTLAFSPDGKKLASGQDDKSGQNVVRVWQVADGQPIATFTVDEKWQTTAVAFSPDGKKLAASDFFGRVKIWDAVTFDQTPMTSFEVGEVNFLAFSPDSKLLACGSGYTPTGVQHIPETIAGYTLGLWDAGTGKQITDLKGHAQTVYAVAFSPDGKTLASGSMDSTIKLWQVASGNLLKTLKGNTALVQVTAFSPDRKLLVNGGDNGSLELLNVQTGQLIAHFQAHFGSVVSLNFSPDGQRLLSTANSPRNGLELKSWSVKDNTLIATNSVPNQSLQAAVVSSDGKLVATGSYDHVTLWDAQTLQKTGQLNTGSQNIYALAFSPDSRELAVNSNSFANIWDVGDGKLLQNLGVSGEEDAKLAFSSDGRWLAVANKKAVQVWNWQTATSQADLFFKTPQGGETNFIEFSSDGKYLVMSSSTKYWENNTKKGLVQVWDWQHQQQAGQTPVDTFGAIYAEWNAASQQVWAVYDNGIIKTWNYR